MDELEKTLKCEKVKDRCKNSLNDTDIFEK